MLMLSMSLPAAEPATGSGRCTPSSAPIPLGEGKPSFMLEENNFRFSVFRIPQGKLTRPGAPRGRSLPERLCTECDQQNRSALLSARLQKWRTGQAHYQTRHGLHSGHHQPRPTRHAKQAP